MDASRIDPQELAARLAGGEAVTLLDTRSPPAWESAVEQLPGARRMPVDQLPARLGELPHDQTIITYCS
jgi:rhodanese-related sulfurtransferase